MFSPGKKKNDKFYINEQPAASNSIPKRTVQNNNNTATAQQPPNSFTSWFLQQLNPQKNSPAPPAKRYGEPQRRGLPPQINQKPEPIEEGFLWLSDKNHSRNRVAKEFSNNNNNNSHYQQIPAQSESDSRGSSENENSLVFLSALLRQWIWMKTKVDIVLIGEKDIGKSFLVNSLLQTTLQNMHNDQDFCIIDDEKRGDERKHFQNEPEIDETFYITPEFEENVKWSNEQMAQTSVREYVSTGIFEPTSCDRHSYLLPQGPFSGMKPKNFCVVYGKVPELIIKFHSEKTVRDNLWKLHEFNFIMGASEAPSSDFEEYLRKQYRQILNLTRDYTQLPLPVTTPSELPLPSSVLSVLGRTHQYIGNGTNPNLDRIFIREKLLEVINQHPFIIDNILIKMPCGVLGGEKQIIVAQTNAIDPATREDTMSRVGSANLVLVAIDQRGPSPDLLDLLKKSGILEKMIWNPDQHKVVFIDLSEKHFVSQPSSASQVLSFSSQKKVEQTRQALFNQIKQLLVSSEHISLNTLPKMEEKISNAISLFFLRPLLFTSLELSGGSITSALQQTNLPELLACIQNIHLSSNSGSLSDFGEQLRTHSENSTKKPEPREMVQQALVKKPSKEEVKRSEPSIFEGISASFLKIMNKPTKAKTKEQLLHEFKQKNEGWRKEWMSSRESMYSFLQQKAQECNQKMTTSQLAFESFVDFVPIYWEKLVIEKVPEKIEDMVTCSFHLLNECSQSVVFPQGGDLKKEKARLQQILKFCKGSAERTIRTKMQQIHHRAMSINIPSIIHTTCVESREVVQINSKAYPRISPQAVSKIYESFSGCVKLAMEILCSIEKHVTDCVQCLTDSPKLRASEIMNFLISSQMSSPAVSEDQIHQQRPQASTQQLNSSAPHFKPASGIKPTTPLLPLQQPKDQMELIQPPSSDPIDFSVSAWEDSLVGRYSNDQNYQKQIFDHHLTAVDVENDANNQFRSLASLIYRTEEAHSIIRLLIMNEMLHNPDQYSHFIPEAINLQQYVYEKSKENEPADYPILFSFCNFYQVNLLLFSPLFLQPLQIKSNHTTQITLALGILSKTNWQVLIKNDPKSGIQINVEEELRRLKQLHISEEDPDNMASLQAKQDPESMMVEGEASHNNQPRVSKVKSLSEMCIGTVCQYIDYMPELEGAVPEDLVQQILTSLIAEEKISPEVLERSLDSSILHLNLSGWTNLFGPSCVVIGNKCNSLELLDVSHCPKISADDLQAMIHPNRSLTKLNLEGCPADDNFLNVISQNCPNLTEINLNGCTLISDQGLDRLLTNCKKITHLYLSGCRHVTKQGFSHLENILKVIDLTECNSLEEDFLISLANYCTQATKISFSGKGVTDRVAEAIVRSSGPKLITLELTNCTNLTQVGLNALAANCHVLENLVLQSCRSLQSEHFACIGSSLYTSFGIGQIAFHRLRKLDLSRCLNVNSISIKNLENCRDLEILSLQSCDEIDEGSLIQLIKKCQKLTEINLSDCVSGVSDRVISALGQRCRNLQKVSVYNCSKITDESLISLSRCTQMVELNASSCERITDHGLRQFASGCKLLKVLFLEECNITDEGIKHVARGCPDLERVSLAYCKGVSNVSLEILSQSCVNLSSLDISYLKNITIDPHTNEIFLRWKRLKQLHLRGMSQFVDQGVEHPTLKTMSLSWCKNLTDQALTQITKGCASLTNLDLAYCAAISTNGIHTLTQHAPNLRYLNIRGCEKISKLMLKYMSKDGRVIIII